MSIIRKVKAVERVFDRLEEEIKTLQSQTDLHCISGCGKCCTKPDIEATVLEFLPLAFHWYSEGKALEELEKLDQETSSICAVYSPISTSNLSSGSCSQYKYRGLICRLFGYSAAKNKEGQLRLMTCKLLKEEQTLNYEKAVALLQEGSYVPVFSDYYKRLIQIDFILASILLPVNEAIAEAIKMVLHHYTYRPFRRPRNAA